MTVFTSVNDPEIARILIAGGVGVLRTDTIYGIVALAGNEAAVRRVYELKGREDSKSPIVLIDDERQIYDELSAAHSAYVREVWPGKVSVIVPSTQAPSWIRRQNDSVAYRMPDFGELRNLVRVTGPLIAPSANPQGMQPAMNLREARYYFGNKIDFYVDGGSVESPEPSKLMKLELNGDITRLR